MAFDDERTLGGPISYTLNELGIVAGRSTNDNIVVGRTASIVKPDIEYKYSEDKILADVKEYIDKTYKQHYKSEDQDIQCLDAWIAMGDATPTFRNTAIKYLWRYGKKNGSNKDDLMKALHYIFFALHNDHYKGK